MSIVDKLNSLISSRLKSKACLPAFDSSVKGIRCFGDETPCIEFEVKGLTRCFRVFQVLLTHPRVHKTIFSHVFRIVLADRKVF